MSERPESLALYCHNFMNEYLKRSLPDTVTYWEYRPEKHALDITTYFVARNTNHRFDLLVSELDVWNAPLAAMRYIDALIRAEKEWLGLGGDYHFPIDNIVAGTLDKRIIDQNVNLRQVILDSETA